MPGGIRAPRDLQERSLVGFMGEGTFDVFLESRDISVRRDHMAGWGGRSYVRTLGSRWGLKLAARSRDSLGIGAYEAGPGCAGSRGRTF